ncbi:MAG: restriction endonuclease subunit S, partial [Campylobacterales bacterium]|nr:restriction endonuclease subunit S [Campylobacterales bacterium]
MDGLEAVELKLSNVLDNNKLFRIESEFFKKNYLKNFELFYENPLLSKYSKRIICGPFGSTILDETYTTNGTKVIRPFNIKNFQIEKENIVYISNEDIKSKNLKLFGKNTIFFSRVGDIKCGIYTDDELVTISPNIIAVEVEENEYNPFFLTLFFNTPFGFEQIKRELKISAQPTVSTERLQQLKLPILDIKIQNVIAKLFQESEQLIIDSNSLYKEAEELLVKELDLLDFIPTEENVSEKSFSESFGSSGRLDSEYYQPKYDEILEKIENYKGGYQTLFSSLKSL